MAAVQEPRAGAGAGAGSSASPRIGAGAGSSAGTTDLSRSRSSGASARRRSKSRSRTTSSSSTPAFLIIALLGALFAIGVLAILIGPELYAFYYYHHAEGALRPPSFAAFLSMRMHERALSSSSSSSSTRRFLVATRSRIFASQWAAEVRKQWSQSILASLPSAWAIPGIDTKFQRSRNLTWIDHIKLLIISPHTHLPWPLSLMPGLFRLAAALSLMPIALIGVADFAGYAVFRTLGLQRRRVRIKRTASPDSKSMAKQHSAMRQATAQRQNSAQSSNTTPTPAPTVKKTPSVARGGTTTPTSQRGGPYPIPFPRPGSGPVSPQPGEAGGAPLLTPGAYDAAMLLRHRARSRSTSGTESADAEAEWARTGGSFARVSAVREAAKRAQDEAQSQGIPPLTLLPMTPTSEQPPAISSSTGQPAISPGPSHASLVSPPASPRTRFFRLRLPGVIGQEGALGMGDLTDFDDSGPESGTSSPVHSFSRASSISSAQGQSFVASLSPSARPRQHRPRIGGFTPLATPSEEDALRPYTTAQQQRQAATLAGAVASAHTSDGDSEDAGDADADGSNASNNPRKHGQITNSAAFPLGSDVNSNSKGGRTTMRSQQADLPHQPPSAPTSPSVRKAMLPDPNMLTKTLRSIANVAKLALTPGPMDPDAARLSTTASSGVHDEDGVEVVSEGEEADSAGNLLGLQPKASDQVKQQREQPRPRRTSLFGDEEINSTYSGAGLIAARSADLEV